MKIAGIWIITGCIIILAACNSNKKGDHPALTKSEMVPVVYQLMLTDEYTTQMKMRDSNLVLKNIRENKYEQVFRLNKTNRTDFESSYQYYLGHPDELKIIFDSVEATATRKRIERMVTPKNVPVHKAVGPK
jgi:hypothetical protein